MTLILSLLFVTAYLAIVLEHPLKINKSASALVGAGLVNEVKLNWVWNPPWGPDKITDDGRDQLRALGFTV